MSQGAFRSRANLSLVSRRRVRGGSAHAAGQEGGGGAMWAPWGTILALGRLSAGSIGLTRMLRISAPNNKDRTKPNTVSPSRRRGQRLRLGSKKRAPAENGLPPWSVGRSGKTYLIANRRCQFVEMIEWAFAFRRIPICGQREPSRMFVSGQPLVRHREKGLK